jgi:hypothetical protein
LHTHPEPVVKKKKKRPRRIPKRRPCFDCNLAQLIKNVLLKTKRKEKERKTARHFLLFD